MIDSVFMWLYKNVDLCRTCPPSENGKDKQMGCYNAVNQYGKEPSEASCKRCWRGYLETEE